MKRMQRLFSALLALAMLLSCTAMAAAVDYTGKWVLTGMQYNGVQFGPNGLADFEISMKMALFADGTMTFTTSDETETGTWRASATGIFINLGDGEEQLTYADGVLTLEDDGLQEMFTREGAAPAIDDTPKQLVFQSNVKPSAFEGTWTVAEIRMLGASLSLSEIGMEIKLELSGGQCMGTIAYDGDRQTATMSYTVKEVQGVGTVLTIAGAGQILPASSTDSQLNLLSDGRLYLKESMEGEKMEYFFVRQGGNIRIAGDANEDGQVDMADVTVTAQHAAGKQITISLSNADVNADGKVDMQDVLLLMQFAAGWSVRLQ